MNEHVERTVDALLEQSTPSVGGRKAVPMNLNQTRDPGWYILQRGRDLLGDYRNSGKSFQNYAAANASPSSRHGAVIVWTDGKRWFRYALQELRDPHPTPPPLRGGRWKPATLPRLASVHIPGLYVIRRGDYRPRGPFDTAQSAYDESYRSDGDIHWTDGKRWYEYVERTHA